MEDVLSIFEEKTTKNSTEKNNKGIARSQTVGLDFMKTQPITFSNKQNSFETHKPSIEQFPHKKGQSTDISEQMLGTQSAFNSRRDNSPSFNQMSSIPSRRSTSRVINQTFQDKNPSNVFPMEKAKEISPSPPPSVPLSSTLKPVSTTSNVSIRKEADRQNNDIHERELDELRKNLKDRDIEITSLKAQIESQQKIISDERQFREDLAQRKEKLLNDREESFKIIHKNEMDLLKSSFEQREDIYRKEIDRLSEEIKKKAEVSLELKEQLNNLRQELQREGEKFHTSITQHSYQGKEEEIERRKFEIDSKFEELKLKEIETEKILYNHKKQVDEECSIREQAILKKENRVNAQERNVRTRKIELDQLENNLRHREDLLKQQEEGLSRRDQTHIDDYIALKEKLKNKLEETLSMKKELSEKEQFIKQSMFEAERIQQEALDWKVEMEREKADLSLREDRVREMEEILKNREKIQNETRKEVEALQRTANTTFSSGLGMKLQAELIHHKTESNVRSMEGQSMEFERLKDTNRRIQQHLVHRSMKTYSTSSFKEEIQSFGRNVNLPKQEKKLHRSPFKAENYLRDFKKTFNI